MAAVGWRREPSGWGVRVCVRAWACACACACIVVVVIVVIVVVIVVVLGRMYLLNFVLVAYHPNQCRQ